MLFFVIFLRQIARRFCIAYILQKFHINIDIVSAILFSKTIKENNKLKIKVQELRNKLKKIITKEKKSKKKIEKLKKNNKKLNKKLT